MFNWLKRRKPSTRDAAIALMVYETWLLHNAQEEYLPSLTVRKWVNKTLRRPLFSET